MWKYANFGCFWRNFDDRLYRWVCRYNRPINRPFFYRLIGRLIGIGRSLQLCIPMISMISKTHHLSIYYKRMQLWKILDHKLEKKLLKLETFFYFCHFRARRYYRSIFGSINEVDKKLWICNEEFSEMFFEPSQHFRLSLYMHAYISTKLKKLDLWKWILTKFPISPFSAANLPQFFEFWKRTLVTNMQQSLLKRKDWRRLEEEWRGRIFKKKFMSWPKWNTPISFISIRSTKMGKMSYLSLSCKSSYKFLFYYI